MDRDFELFTIFLSFIFLMAIVFFFGSVMIGTTHTLFLIGSVVLGIFVVGVFCSWIQSKYGDSEHCDEIYTYFKKNNKEKFERFLKILKTTANQNRYQNYIYFDENTSRFEFVKNDKFYSPFIGKKFDEVFLFLKKIKKMSTENNNVGIKKYYDFLNIFLIPMMEMYVLRETIDEMEHDFEVNSKLRGIFVRIVEMREEIESDIKNQKLSKLMYDETQ